MNVARGAVTALVLLAACGTRESGPELVLTNARVMTLDSASRVFTTVAIGGGRVLALADSVDPSWTAAGAKVTDLGGATVAPAFTDHHVHLLNVGMALLNQRDSGRLAIDLSHVTSLAEVASLVGARAARLPKGSWILGSGWSQASWGTGSLPSAEVLTRAAPDHPVFLARTDGHAGWVNGLAIRMAGVDSSVTRGILLERDNERMTALLPAPSDSDVVTAFRLAAEALAARGVVEVYDAGALLYPGAVALNLDFGRYLRLLVRTDSIAALPLRINLMIPAPSALADSVMGAPGGTVLSPRIRITHLKLFADGALGSRGAALSHRYADDSSTTGVARMTTEEIGALARRSLARGLSVATHAIGDEAVHRTLDAYEAILRERKRIREGQLRIEHFSYGSEADFKRAAQLGVILSVQSTFNASPGDSADLGALRVGAANAARVYNWARLDQMGAVLAEGSDYFTAPGPALAGFRAVLERKYALGQGLPDSAARVLSYRLMATRYEPDGGKVDGVIRVGGVADLVAWTADPFRVGVGELDGVTVKLLVSQGRVLTPR